MPIEKPRSQLTPRERQVLQLAAGGASNREIAQALGITKGNVRNKMTAVYKHYGVNGRIQAVIHGIMCGDVDELRAYADVEFRRREA